jgi:hypothetical protein
MAPKTNMRKPPKRSTVKPSAKVVEAHIKELDEFILRLETTLERLEDQAAESDRKTRAAIEKADSLLRKLRTA